MGRSVSCPSGALVAYTHFEDEMEYHEWEEQVEMFREIICDLWPSASPCDGWRGREDRVVARNGLAEFGVSEYCGLVALWVAPRADLDSTGPLAGRWIESIRKRFLDNFGTLRKIGTASNGEAFFERVA